MLFRVCAGAFWLLLQAHQPRTHPTPPTPPHPTPPHHPPHPTPTYCLTNKVLALVAMEQPVSCHPDDIRDEKCRVLRCIAPVKPSDCILGQYVAARGQPGYLDDPTVRLCVL